MERERDGPVEKGEGFHASYKRPAVKCFVPNID